MASAGSGASAGTDVDTGTGAGIGATGSAGVGSAGVVVMPGTAGSRGSVWQEVPAQGLEGACRAGRSVASA